jgi:hypothetical protein
LKRLMSIMGCGSRASHTTKATRPPAPNNQKDDALAGVAKNAMPTAIAPA